MAWRRCGRLLDMVVSRLDRAGTGASLRTRRMIAGRKLAAGARFLDRGRFLITDRLHGHILAVLLAKPHAVLDNTTGKNAAFLESWTGKLSFVSLVEDIDAAVAAAATSERAGS
jgi:pyruvyl transferase EpsO